MITYRLEQEMSELFPGTEFVPYGYPVEKVHQEVVREVAGLSPVGRQRLLEEIEPLWDFGGPQKPIMSNRRSGIVYEGSDWEDPDPRIVYVDGDPQSLEK
jgi:hypothetical protein